MKRTIFVILLILSLSSVGASAATYYVSTNGNDGNAGTQILPWRTLQRAANSAVAGDTVNVRGGTYSERVTFPNSGNAGGYITFQNYPGETPVFSGVGLGAGLMMSITSKAYLKVVGLTIADNLGGGIAAYCDSHHIEFRNMTIYNQTWQQGIEGHAMLASSLCWPNLGHQDHIVFDGNTIHDVVTGVGDNYDEAMTISWSVDTFQMTNNTLYNITYIGMDLIGKSLDFTRSYLPWTVQPTGNPWPSNGVVSGNVVHDGGWGGSYPNTGIYVDGAQDFIVEHNTVYNYARYGIVLSAEDGTFQTNQVIVRYNIAYNNIVNIDCGGFIGRVNAARCTHNTTFGGSVSNLFNAQGLDVVWKNNISYAVAGQHHFTHYLGTGDNPQANFNLYWPDAFFQYKGTEYFSFASYKNNTGQDAQSLLANPLFVDSNGADFHLQSGSPAINAGTTLTQTVSAGSGTSLQVLDARYFSSGYTVTSGDVIKVGTTPIQVTAVNYGTNILTLASGITWGANVGVSYLYNGSAPDMGAYETGIDTGPLPVPRNVRLVTVP